MSKPTRFEHNRFLGDKRTLVVHDLDHPSDECAISELVASERFLTFGPDTLAEARNRGYRPCKRGCLPRPVQQEPYEVAP
jgi:hypothetical protein